MTRVLVAAADRIVRTGLRALLAEVGDLEFGGEGELAELAERLAGGARTSDREAEAVLADLPAGDDSALDDLARLAAAAPRLGVIVLARTDGDAARRCLRAGARGVLSRDASIEEIGAALRAAAIGLTVLDARSAHAAFGESLASAISIVADRPVLASQPVEPLTPRETEVLRLLAEGLPSKAIAPRLGISEHTVKFHIGAILGKLGAASRTEAVAIGVRRGLIAL